MYQLFALLALMICGVTEAIPMESALIMLSLVLLFNSAAFYWVVWSAVIGTIKFYFQDDLNGNVILARKVTEWAGAYFVYMGGLELVAAFLLPWLLITTASDICALLLQSGFLEFEEDTEEVKTEDIDE